MPKPSKVHAKPKSQPQTLKGWKQIADFLGEPVSVVKRWESEGMPVAKQGRFVYSTPEQLNHWLGRESGKPVQVVTPQTDLTSELKRAIAFARQSKKNPPKMNMRPFPGIERRQRVPLVEAGRPPTALAFRSGVLDPQQESDRSIK